MPGVPGKVDFMLRPSLSTVEGHLEDAFNYRLMLRNMHKVSHWQRELHNELAKVGRSAMEGYFG